MDNALDAYKQSLSNRNIPVIDSVRRIDCIELVDSILRRTHKVSLYGPSIALVTGEMLESCSRMAPSAGQHLSLMMACLNDYLLVAYKHGFIDEIPWKALVPEAKELEADLLIDGDTNPQIDFLPGDVARSLKPHILTKYASSFRHYLRNDKPERYWNIYVVNSVKTSDGAWVIKDVRFIQKSLASYSNKNDESLIYSLFINGESESGCEVKQIAHGLLVGYGRDNKPLFFAVHADNNIYVPDNELPSWFAGFSHD